MGVPMFILIEKLSGNNSTKLILNVDAIRSIEYCRAAEYPNACLLHLRGKEKYIIAKGDFDYFLKMLNDNGYMMLS